MTTPEIFATCVIFVLGVNAGIFIGFMLAYGFGAGMRGMKRFIEYMEGKRE